MLQGIFFIAGMTTAERAASSVAKQERCRPLYSEQSSCVRCSNRALSYGHRAVVGHPEINVGVYENMSLASV